MRTINGGQVGAHYVRSAWPNAERVHVGGKSKSIYETPPKTIPLTQEVIEETMKKYRMNSTINIEEEEYD